MTQKKKFSVKAMPGEKAIFCGNVYFVSAVIIRTNGVWYELISQSNANTSRITIEEDFISEWYEGYHGKIGFTYG